MVLLSGAIDSEVERGDAGFAGGGGLGGWVGTRGEVAGGAVFGGSGGDIFGGGDGESAEHWGAACATAVWLCVFAGGGWSWLAGFAGGWDG